MEEVKKGKKKNKVASLLLALALILTCGVAGTIAQYQKSFGGNATAQVAKFDVSATGLSEDNSAVLDLFSNREDTHSGTNSDSAVNDNLIAPGTRGKMPITLINNSEVKVKYTLTTTLDGGTLTGKYKDTTYTTATGKMPLKFAISNTDSYPTDPGDWKTWDQISSSINAQDQEITGTSTKYLCWQWAFGTDGADDATNRLDTAIGIAMSGTYSSDDGGYKKELDDPTNPLIFKAPKVTVSVKFTQVD